MKFGDLTWMEIRERAVAGDLVIVPTGCTEQQGPHLPVDFDTWFAETLALAAADRARKLYGVRALVLPALPFGPTQEHRGYGAGFVDLPQNLHEAVLTAILTSLAEQGFQRIVIWQGCGGHRLQAVVERFNAGHSGNARALLPESPFHAIWNRLGNPAIPGGHADSFTTSIMLHLRPDAVHLDRIVHSRSQPVPWHDPDLDLARYSATGGIGDPTAASGALGSRLWTACVDAVAEALEVAASR